MKFRSVLKKLKKKKKSSFDGVVVNDEAQSSALGAESEEISTSKPKIIGTKNRSASGIGSQKPQLAQRGSSDPSSYDHLYQKSETNRIRSDVQHSKNERKEAKGAKDPTATPARATNQKRSLQSLRSSGKAVPKDENQQLDQFQDEFGVESNETTWASFGDSSGFFNSTQRSGSIFTESTFTQSESSLSSPTNSSFESIKSSQELSSSEDLPSRRSSPPSSARPTMSSPVNNTQEKQMMPASPALTQERRSDRSLSGLKVVTHDRRQRASPTVSEKKNPSPVTSSSSKPSMSSPSQESPAATASSTKSVPSPLSKRRSITERYTAALNTSASESSPTAAPKLFRARSKKSVLDNHPLFRKRSMVEQEDLPITKPQEERELPEVVQGNTSPSSKFARRSSSTSIQQQEEEEVTEEIKEEKEQDTTIQTPPPTDLSVDEPKEDGNLAAVVVTDQDSTGAPSQEGSDGPAVVSEPIDVTTSIEVSGNVLATEEEPTMEEDQLEASQDVKEEEEAPQESQVEGFEEEEEEEIEMPILSTSPEFDSVPPQAPLVVSTVDTVNSSVAQSSKATTVSGGDGGESDSDSETAPIGELSFDSNSKHSEGNTRDEEDTLDFTYDPDAVSVLSEDFTDYSQYTHELSRSKRGTDRFGRWVENTIFGMANFMCPMEDGDVYDA